MAQARRWTAVLLGAGAVAVTVAAVAVLAPGEPPPRAGAEPTGSTAPRPAEWRTEYWHDVAVDVPADWWYGGGPMADGEQALACYAEPIVSPEGERREGRGSSAPGWVGRPLHLTDVCAVVGEQRPEKPYLLFDAPVDIGTVDLAGGSTSRRSRSTAAGSRWRPTTMRCGGRSWRRPPAGRPASPSSSTSTTRRRRLHPPSRARPCAPTASPAGWPGSPTPRP